MYNSMDARICKFGRDLFNKWLCHVACIIHEHATHATMILCFASVARCACDVDVGGPTYSTCRLHVYVGSIFNVYIQMPGWLMRLHISHSTLAQKVEQPQCNR